MSFDDLWNRYMGRDVTPEAYAAEGWSAGGIYRDLYELWADHSTDRLSAPQLADIADQLAAGLEERGLGPTAPAEDLESITLTVAHAASSYGRPVLVIDGEAYGPADMTPAGQPAAHIVTDWAARFIATLPAEVRELLLRQDYEEAAILSRGGADLGALAPAMLGQLRRLLAAYEGHYLVPPDEMLGIWADAKKLIRQAEGAGL